MPPPTQPHRLDPVQQSEERLRSTIRKLRASASLVPVGEREDLVQEAMARALRQGVSPDALPYLRTVVRNLAIDRARKVDEVPTGDAAEVERLAPNGGAEPEDAVVSSEACEEIRRALDELPPRYREALLVFAEEGRPAGLSDRLGLSPNATWTLLSRARRRLRTQLEGAGIVPGVVALPLWRLRLKLKELVAAGTAGAVATGAALTITVTAPTPGPAPAPEETARPHVVASDTAEAPAEPVAETPAPAAKHRPAPEDVEAQSVATPEPTAEPVLKQEAEVCDPGGEGSTRGWLALEREKDPSLASVAIEPVATVVPSSLRNGENGEDETGGC